VVPGMVHLVLGLVEQEEVDPVDQILLSPAHLAQQIPVVAVVEHMILVVVVVLLQHSVELVDQVLL